jgi:hypothetical protein
MRKLVLILIGFIAVITFIRAFDNTAEINPDVIRSNGVQSATFQTGVPISTE